VTADPFLTAPLRHSVLRTWQESPGRFRQDANLEEDYARGFYRDRVAIELAQNAADAAEETPGRVVFVLHPDETSPSGWSLTVANTGAPLTADGVASLASLRASAKRDESDGGRRTVGRFGVGFAAVRAVSDHVIAATAQGSVTFDLSRTRAALDYASYDSPELAAEVARRDDELPLLRLPFADDVTVQGLTDVIDVEWQEEISTTIKLHLRDDDAVSTVQELLAEVHDELLLALPALQEIVIAVSEEPPRVISDLESRWHITRETGEIPAELTASLPVEDRDRTTWTITWASKKTTDSATSLIDDQLTWQPTKLLAPTPTDEPVTYPATLLISLPLDPTRRHVRPGPVTDWLITKAGKVAAHHARKLDHPLRIVPTGLPASEIDRHLSQSVRDAVASEPLLTTLNGLPIAAEEAQVVVLNSGAHGELAGSTPVIDQAALTELAGGTDGIITLPGQLINQAAAIGVRAVNAADLALELPAGRTPARWQETYQALSGLTREVGGTPALAGLPVPLVDGRIVSGPRGAFAVSDDVDPETASIIASWGMRLVHPGAHHSLLETLGAVPVTANELVNEPEIRTAVSQLASADEPDHRSIDAVLDLTRAAQTHRASDEPPRPWLMDLPLEDNNGEWCGAGGLLIPNTRAQEIFDTQELAAVAPETLEKWGADVLNAVGVRSDLVTVTGTITLDAWDIDHSIDQALDEPGIGMLDQLDDYLDNLADEWLENNDTEPGDHLNFTLTALADLDAVTDEAWPEIRAEVEKWVANNAGEIELPDGRNWPHYLAWWLEQNLK